MRRALVITIVFVTLMLPAALQAHNGKHWTNRQAERNLIRYDLSNRDGQRITNVVDAVCDGYGHNFIASNGLRVYSKFSCAVYHTRGGPWCIDYWVRRGGNAVWLRDDPRFCF
jgi:hypothetical protein